MTNREWLFEQMQNMSDDELAKMILVPTEMEQDICAKQDCMYRDCEDCLIYWLKYEHKEPIKLKEAERVILENIPEEYKWIARDDKENAVWIYSEKPTKNGKWWLNGSNAKYGICVDLFPNLFQFIKWEDKQPYNIEELLKGDIKDDD